jgi:hypothetical protein
MEFRSFLSPLGLPRLGNSPELLQRPEQVELGPLFHHLAPLQAVYLYAAHLDPLASSRHAEELLPLVRTTNRVAGHYLVAFGYLLFYGAGEVREGVTEPHYVFLYGLYSANLSCLDVWVVADEVGVKQVVDQLRLALAEGLLHQTARLLLVLFQVRGLYHRHFVCTPLR